MDGLPQANVHPYMSRTFTPGMGDVHADRY